ncbi:MAG TPA: serine/threonine-protein kinase [Micromonosporaceae bacterium]|nr:serine/threonine-protein kinase [Micromonosporaceae bacterium]
MDPLSAGVLLARRYRLIDQIGAGGMSVVWRARDEVLDRVVAVKALAPSLSADPALRRLVRDEARSAARLVHPHVAAVHDFSEGYGADGAPIAFVVMEVLDGEPLAARLTAGPLPWTEAARIGAQVAAALAAAHRLGIVHRDITPDNIMLTAAGAKVFDFGIATRTGAPDEDEDGTTFGTPTYVAPERLDGVPARPASDVYSLGVLLFEMLAGHPPYRAETWDDLVRAAGQTRAPRLDRVPGLPRGIAGLCVRCLARDPTQRPTAYQVAARLRASRGRPALAAGVCAVAVAAAVAIGATVVPHRVPGPLPGPAPAVSAAPPAATAGVLDLLRTGEAAGEIRPDVALDLRQVIQGLPDGADTSAVRRKVADRVREGGISEGFAAQVIAAITPARR